MYISLSILCYVILCCCLFMLCPRQINKLITKGQCIANCNKNSNRDTFSVCAVCAQRLL